jgi:hypothetical protein
MRTVFVLFSAACSYTFDANAPAIPLVGAPPEMAKLPRLNTAPVDSEAFTTGADGRSWLVMTQNDKTWRAIDLYDSSKMETIKNVDDVLVTGNALYITKTLPATGTSSGQVTQYTEMTVRHAGEAPGNTFTLPSNGPAILLSGGNDQVFAYLVADPTVPGYFLQRRDGRYSRLVHWPKGVDPADPFSNPNLMLFWDYGYGVTFYDRDNDGRIVGHHTMDNMDIDLGIRPQTLIWLDPHHLVTCGNDGVRIVSTDGVTPEVVLDNDICTNKLLQFDGDSVVYEVGDVIRKTKLDSSAPPTTLHDLGNNRLLRLNSDESIFYSTDPSGRYVHDAGDGWLKGWKFMNRGINLHIASDQKSLYWLESAAEPSGAGELTMVTLPGPLMPGGKPRPLARNVRDFGIMDSRIVCNENYSFPGTFNRIILINLEKNKAQWLADSANHWTIFHHGTEAIVDVVTGATSGHDVVRVPVPPPLP